MTTSGIGHVLNIILIMVNKRRDYLKIPVY
jgi:hypothetical protein